MYFITKSKLDSIWRGANPFVCTRSPFCSSTFFSDFFSSDLSSWNEALINSKYREMGASKSSYILKCISRHSRMSKIRCESECLAQLVLRQGPILKLLMQYLPVASGGLQMAAIVSREWYAASTAHINSLCRTLKPNSYHSTAIQMNVKQCRAESRPMQFMPPKAFLAHVLTRRACCTVLQRGKLPNMLRVFHFINSWKHSDIQLRRLLIVLGSQTQIPNHPLLIDSFLAASSTAAHIAYVWSSIENLLERDAKAVLAHLSSSIANLGATGNFRGENEYDAFSQMDRETMVLEGWKMRRSCVAQYRLRKINRPLLLNVYNWTVRWLGMLQHPLCVSSDESQPKPSILSAEAIDIAIHRVFYALDVSSRLAWESMLHQILRCINKWLGITHAMAQILESIEEHSNMVQQMLHGTHQH